MKPNTGDTECSPSAWLRAPWAVAVDVAAEVAGDVTVLGQAAVDEGRGLVVLRGDRREYRCGTL